jgi:predicted phage terminase large subunit-like protein
MSDEESSVSILDATESDLNRKSKARRDLVERINNVDFSDFDISPWKDPNVIRPIPGKQEQFILSDADITFFIGGSGTGKSEAMVLDQLQHVNDPNYESITFRRTTKSLKGAGGIFNKAGRIYERLGAEKRINDLMYIWPSGATARYSHLEHGLATAEANHAGLEYARIYYDELHTFDKDSFMFMLSRLRSNAEVDAAVKATMNPTPKETIGGWIHEFLEGFYIDEYGYPIEEASGVKRYFITDDDGRLIWADCPEDLQAQYGFDCAPLSFTAITSCIIDNPVLMVAQPRYLPSLKNMGRIARERLLYCCWNVSPKGAGYFQREWIEYVDRKDLPKMKRVIRAYDLAASVKSEINSDPDWTAGVLMGLGEDGYIYIINAKEELARPAGVMKLIQDTAEYDGKGVAIGLPQDAGQAGIIAYQHYAQPLVLMGYKVKKFKTRKGKLERFSGFSNAAENNMVRIVKGDWNDKYITQLENFDPDRKRQHDD